MNLPFVSFVIPARNEMAHIGDCLESISGQNYPKNLFEIIVVDNASTDSTPEIAKTHNATVLSKINGHVGAVRNYGAQHARGEVFAFIDADCLIDPDWLTRAVEMLERNHDTVIGGGCLLPKRASWIETKWLLGKGTYSLPKNLIGASTVIRKDAFLRVGGFNEQVTSGEDTLLSNDLLREGYKVLITETLSVTHLGNAKTIREFFNRQVWHSENYLIHIHSSLSDPVFFLIVIEIFLIATSIANILIGQFEFSIFTIIASLAIPLLFSAKRIYRAGMPKFSLFDFLKIYFLDFLYVTGRICGLFKGIIGRNRN